MKIVQVLNSSMSLSHKAGDAPQTVILNTSKRLAIMGQDVAIIERYYSSTESAIDTVDGVKVIRLGPEYRAPSGNNIVSRLVSFTYSELQMLRYAFNISRYLRKSGGEIDVIHVHLTSLGLMLILLNRRLRYKMFYTCHLGQWEMAQRGLPPFERIHLMIDAYVMRRVNIVIALNATARESFISLGRVKEDKIVVLPNGVDTDFFRPDIRIPEPLLAKYGIAGKVAVLFVGRLARIKGVEHLVRAVDLVVNEYGSKSVAFLIVGPKAYGGIEEPVSMEKMLGYIKRHQLEGNIILTGALPLEEVKALYAVCDIFVLPSLAEGDPLVILEAMSSGEPVIGTNVVGIPHHIRDGWNGFLVDPANEQQLAEKIKFLIDNPEDRKRMGENSRKYAEEEFDWSKVAERLLAVYQS
jgi:glycosyltransferase involved in cell wall biosynthesis